MTVETQRCKACDGRGWDGAVLIPGTCLSVHSPCKVCAGEGEVSFMTASPTSESPLEPFDASYEALLDLTLSDPDILAGMGFPGPWSAASALKAIDESPSSILLGVRGPHGPAGILYALESANGAAEIHLSILVPMRGCRRLFWDALRHGVAFLFRHGYVRLHTFVNSKRLALFLDRRGCKVAGCLESFAIGPRGPMDSWCILLSREEWDGDPRWAL